MVVLATAAALGLSLGACSTADSAAVRASPRITDTTFEKAASAVCTKAVRTFDVATTLPKNASNAQSAALLMAIDQIFAAMVAQLHQVPVSAADQTTINHWLADWDSYVAFGHTYANAVLAGTDGILVRNDSASQGALRRRLQAFAVANHMASCKFQ